MLELRPNCEHCNKPLPPASAEARICSYECTFCADCVFGVLSDACPNCGGGFVPRPIRPAVGRVGGHFPGNDPAAITTGHRQVDRQAHRALVERIGALPPAER